MEKGNENQQDSRLETIVLGGGCFWCTEAVYQQVRGVRSVVSGYAGGATAHPDYEAVCSGTTGHAECVRIEFDPAEIGFDDILRIFFATHDPTTLNRQGNDVGTQYRSAIFWHTEAQRDTAQRIIAEVESQHLHDAPLVTEVAPLDRFWPAEAEHQNYWRRHPGQGYCALVISPKVAKFRKQFAARLSDV